MNVDEVTNEIMVMYGKYGDDDYDGERAKSYKLSHNS
jgi:hypothetical protein